MKIESNYKVINKSDWGNFISYHPYGNFFQSPQFIHFLSKINNFEAVTLFALSENQIKGILCGVIQKEGSGIKSFFTSRLIIWGAPLVDNENKEIAEVLIKALSHKYSQKAIYIEFRNLFLQQHLQAIFKKYRFEYLPYINFVVKTDNEVDVRKRMSKSKVRQIKSSLKNGCEITEAQNEDEVIDFYDILSVLYKNKVKKPLPDIHFFIEFWKQTDLGKILLVKKEGKIIGGIVCPIFENKTIYEWYVCGLDGQEKGIYPSILATYAPVDYALENNFKCFDFMGAGRLDADYGVREFKSKFGGEQVEYGRYTRINKPFLYKIGKIGIKILGKLK